MKRLKKYFIFSITLVCFLALTGTAYATNVQIDGKVMQSSYQPINVEGRVYLPLRSVFEDLGAEVNWNGATNEVTAVKDEIKVTFAIGDTQAYVTTASTERYVPFYGTALIKDDATYVPVRFAAEALGLNVGWDGENQTVLIVDTEKLLAQYQYSSATIDKIWKYLNRRNGGGFQFEGKVDVVLNSMSEGIEIPTKATTTYEGLTDVGKNTRIKMIMNFDLEETANALQLSKEELQAIGLDYNTYINMEYEADLMNGYIYFKSDKLNQLLFGLPSNTWLKVDLKALMGVGVEEYQALLLDPAQINLKKIFEEAVRNYALTNIYDYASLHAILMVAQSLFDDNNFVYNSQTASYENKQNLTQDASIGIAVKMSNEDSIEEVLFSCAMSMDEDTILFAIVDRANGEFKMESYIFYGTTSAAIATEGKYFAEPYSRVNLSATSSGNTVDFLQLIYQMYLSK